MKDYVGCEFQWNENGVKIHQNKLIKQLIDYNNI